MDADTDNPARHERAHGLWLRMLPKLCDHQIAQAFTKAVGR